MEDSLNALDATFLELEEADDSAHMHIGAVMLFEPEPGETVPIVEQVRARVGARLDSLPRFRQRLSAPHTGGLRWPRWVDDPRFDLEAHIRAAALPAPAGEGELREWAADYFSRRLDRDRPLWELVMIELADGRWALVSKTHHCLVDGVGSLDIGQTILDLERDPVPNAADRPPRPDDPPPEPAAQGSPGWRRLPIEAAVAVARVPREAVRAAGGLARGGLGLVSHPGRAQRSLERSRAMVDVLLRDELIAAPPTSINEPIGGARRLAVVEVDLDELKWIKRALGGTVNDVVLAVSAGALRRLLEHRGERPPRAGLRAMVPVNIRTAAERLSLGNRITSLFVHLPVAEADPLRRYELQLDEAERLKAGTQALGSREIIDLAAHAPPVIHTFLARSLFATRLFNLTITNVPGPQFPLYAFGSRLRAVWPLVPLAAEHVLGIAVFSFDARLFFCVNAARSSMPDLDVLARGIEVSIAELSELARSARGTTEQFRAATTDDATAGAA
jgi:diacylglycerol O-acyltransferase / wax synthase